jgi:hypothetical protein
MKTSSAVINVLPMAVIGASNADFTGALVFTAGYE